MNEAEEEWENNKWKNSSSMRKGKYSTLKIQSNFIQAKHFYTKMSCFMFLFCSIVADLCVLSFFVFRTLFRIVEFFVIIIIHFFRIAFDFSCCFIGVFVSEDMKSERKIQRLMKDEHFKSIHVEILKLITWLDGMNMGTWNTLKRYIEWNGIESTAVGFCQSHLICIECALNEHINSMLSTDIWITGGPQRVEWNGLFDNRNEIPLTNNTFNCWLQWRLKIYDS